MINNYSHIGFLPGNSLQSSEMNEIQERFYLDQTLNNIFLNNWLIFTDNTSIVTGRNEDPYYGPSVNNIIPLNPNLIESYISSGNLIVKMKIGWYRLNNIYTNQASIWCYLNEDKEASIEANLINGKYTLSIELDYTEILCTDDENNEGYFFNSNVGGYIEPWIRGSNRFKLNITQFKIIEPANQQQSDLTIGQIRTNIDGIPSGRFLIQYNNNYKINDITI